MVTVAASCCASVAAIMLAALGLPFSKHVCDHWDRELSHLCPQLKKIQGLQ